MTVIAMSWALWRDHFRRGAILAEVAVVGLTIALFLDPRGAPYEMAFAGMVCGLAACAISAISSSILASRAADMRAEILLLTAGRAKYYIAVIVAGVGTSLLWTAILIGAYLLNTGGNPGGTLGLAVGGIALNVLVTVSAFCAFSALCGSSLQIVLPIALLIVGLNPPDVPLLPSGMFPPLLQNVRATMGAVLPATLWSLAYAAVLTGIGIARFARREFYWK